MLLVWFFSNSRYRSYLLKMCYFCFSIAQFRFSSMNLLIWMFWVYSITSCWTKKHLTESLIKSKHFHPLGIINPKNPKEAPKSFSFDYSYWSHTSVSVLMVQRGRTVGVLNLLKEPAGPQGKQRLPTSREMKSKTLCSIPLLIIGSQILLASRDCS